MNSKKVTEMKTIKNQHRTRNNEQNTTIHGRNKWWKSTTNNKRWTIDNGNYKHETVTRAINEKTINNKR